MTLGQSVLEKTVVDKFNVEKVSLCDAAQELSRSCGISICVEETKTLSELDKDIQFRALEKKSTVGITLSLKNESVEYILNKIVKVDRNYKWEFDESTEIVNIHPVNNAPLDWTLENISINEKTFREIFLLDDLLGLKEQKIAFDTEGGNLSWLDLHVSLNANSITVRKALNQLCKQLTFKARWELYKKDLENFGIQFILVFRGYGIFPENNNSKKEMD